MMSRRRRPPCSAWPTCKDFDDVTRQLTELRREVRTLTRQVRDQKTEGAR